MENTNAMDNINNDVKSTSAPPEVGACRDELVRELDAYLGGPARVTTVEPGGGALAEIVVHRAQDSIGSACGAADEHSICIHADRIEVRRWSDGAKLAEFARPIEARRVAGEVMDVVDIDWQLLEHVPYREIHRYLEAVYKDSNPIFIEVEDGPLSGYPETVLDLGHFEGPVHVVYRGDRVEVQPYVGGVPQTTETIDFCERDLAECLDELRESLNDLTVGQATGVAQ